MSWLSVSALILHGCKPATNHRLRRAAWEAHRRLLTTNRSYGAALAAGATAIVRQLEPIDVVAAIVATAFAIVAAMRQSNTVDQADRWLDFDDPDPCWRMPSRRH